MPSSAMTSTGMAIGTPSYMAPEQLAGDPAGDHRIDIYALGLLAYELLKGKSPFAATTPQKILAAVLTQDPVPLKEVRPDAPQSLSDLVMKCLSKEPEERPESARAVLNALDIFSNASGEIRTMEHRIPRRTRTAATGVPTATEDPGTATGVPVTTGSPVTTPPDPALSTMDLTVAGLPQSVDGDRPRRNGKKMVLGGLAVLLPVAALAIFLSQRAGNQPSEVATTPIDSPAVAPPAAVVAAITPDTAAPIGAPVAAPIAPVDAKAVADSLKRAAVADSVRRAARAEAAKKAAARTDSVQRATNTSAARRAAQGLLANAGARDAFTRGATRMGGPLGTRRRGDLQTQIDALYPFLTNAGLTYEQFKTIVADSGISLFDEFGRMRLSAMQQFAAGN
jgi:serine/threonine-protein kinase